MRAVTRLSGVSINTMTKLLEDVGLAACLYPAQIMVNLPCKRVECDEIWAFCYAKEMNVAPADKGVLGFGDVYTWTAICADTMLIPAFMVGKRDADYANAFIADLASRLASRVQLTTDGHRPYLKAVEGAFRRDMDYAMLVKHHGPGCALDQRHYSPSEFINA